MDGKEQPDPPAMNGVSVKATYFIVHQKKTTGDDDDIPAAPSAPESTTTTTTKLFDASNTVESMVGLLPGIKPIPSQPGDYSYSGMHDQGPLPALKEGGPTTAVLLGCIQAAKEYNNVFLSELIEKEKQTAKTARSTAKAAVSSFSPKAHHSRVSSGNGPFTKKSKTEGSGD